MERLICLLIGYVCGLFQTGYLVGKLYKTDIRQHGSGNAGTTNALRTFGKKAAAATLLGDLLKCVIAMTIAAVLYKNKQGEILPLLTMYAAAGCILGHNFPVTMGFRGGKGFAASVGMVIFFDWKLLVIGAIVFFLIFFTTHYVSLGSMTSYVFAFISMIIFGQMGLYSLDQPHLYELYVLMGMLTVLVFVRHRKNIQRLKTGTESKVFLSSKGK